MFEFRRFRIWEILNPEGHPNRITGSKVTAILLNGWIFPIGGASSGRVCSCSLRSRLVLLAVLAIMSVLAELAVLDVLALLAVIAVMAVLY